MKVRIIPLEFNHNDGLKFDVVIEDGYIKTFTMDSYAIKQYRGASIAEVIEQKVLDFLQELGHNIETVELIFC